MLSFVYLPHLGYCSYFLILLNRGMMLVNDYIHRKAFPSLLLLFITFEEADLRSVSSMLMTN
ncbi:hypothetical protein Glaag_3058 [Glaciecola sp. 4H-3-7+YE-5]|nr:hypothetical protein Glaag_3058 [Glaciecola sp. 4H-3-7+YE-5]